MTPVLLQTKFHVPQLRPELVRRPQLVDKLNAGLRSPGGSFTRRLTLVSAPAGFGKSTLLAEWATQGDQPASWLSLDKSESEPVRFWTYVIAAIQKVHPEVGKSTRVALQSPQNLPLELLLTTVINELGDVQLPLTLILDDFHVITDPQVNEGLVFFLDHLPPTIHLVLSGRADPAWPLGLRRTRGEMVELRADDLRFTIEEATDYLNDAMGLGLTSEDIHALDAQTEGWIAGLQLAGLALQEKLSVHGQAASADFIKSFGASHRYVLDYLIEEVLDQQPEEIQLFLLRTSILEQMTASLASAVYFGDTEDSDEAAGRDILSQLERTNLFLIPLDDERRWYRYHHLFAELLRGRLHRALADELPLLHRRASAWYEEHDLMDEALAHAAAAGDFDHAADLVEANGMQMIAGGELSRLSRWLDLIPDDFIRTRPWLCVYLAWARYYGGPRDRVEKNLQDAEAALNRIPDGQIYPISDEGEHTAVDTKHVAGHIAALRAYLALQDEDFDSSFELAQTALELLPEDDFARGMSAIALAETPRRFGDLVASESAYRKARAVAERCGNMPMAVSAVAYMGLQQAKQGRLHQAAVSYHEALRLAVDSDGNELPAAGLPYVRLGDLMRERNDLDTASSYLDKGIELCRQWGHADTLVVGTVSLARVRLAQGELDQAQDLLDKAESLARKTAVDPWAETWLDDGRIRLWLAAGEVSKAASWVERSGLTTNDELSFVRDLEHVNLARVLVARGATGPEDDSLQDALFLLARVLDKAESKGWLTRSIEILALQAQVLAAVDRNEQAIETLSRAITIAEPQGYIRIFVDEGLPIKRLLREAVAREAGSGFASSLLKILEGELADSAAEVRKEPQTLSCRPEQMVEPLTEREFQVLQLLATELPVGEIAGELTISVNTARSHIQHIYDKLGVHSRYEAVSRASELNLL